VLGDFSFEDDRKMDFRSMKIKSEVMLDKLIFEQLRMLRKEIARNEDVPPYVIFHDSTLHEMVEKMPVTREEMLLVSGVSASKFDKYGTLFLNAIIATNPPKRKESRILLSEAVQEAYLSKCIQELQEKGISVSGTAISKILLGTPDKRFDQFQESISFYGALGGEKLGPKALFELIRSKVDPIKEQIENSKKEDIVKQVQDFLKECSNESLTEDEENKYRKAISDIIVEQNYFAPQENQLASRAGQHWTDLERTMLDELISKTSNIEKIASIMSRGEKSILYMIHETQKVK
jgi:ribonuclease D